MDKSRHCNLCDNQIHDFQTGSRCGLTGEFPNFDSSCSDILLTEKFENKLKEVNIEFERVKKLKSQALIQSGLYAFLAFGIIVAGYLLGKFILDKGVISTVPIIIMSAGLIALSTAFGPINSYRNQMSVAKMKKKNVDIVLPVYGIDYDIDVEFGREYHGTTEVKANLKLKR